MKKPFPSDGDPSPHAEGNQLPSRLAEWGAKVVLVNSIRVGHQRPFCSGCGGPLDDYYEEPE